MSLSDRLLSEGDFLSSRDVKVREEGGGVLGSDWSGKNRVIVDMLARYRRDKMIPSMLFRVDSIHNREPHPSNYFVLYAMTDPKFQVDTLPARSRIAMLYNRRSC